jgi:hypothetical protein
MYFLPILLFFWSWNLLDLSYALIFRQLHSRHWLLSEFKYTANLSREMKDSLQKTAVSAVFNFILLQKSETVENLRPENDQDRPTPRKSLYWEREQYSPNRAISQWVVLHPTTPSRPLGLRGVSVWLITERLAYASAKAQSKWMPTTPVFASMVVGTRACRNSTLWL